MSATDGPLRHIWTNDLERDAALRMDATKELLRCVDEAVGVRGDRWALERSREIIANLCYKLSVTELANQLVNATKKFRHCTCGGYEPIDEGTAYARLMDVAAEFRSLIQETEGVAGFTGRGIVTPWESVLEYPSYANKLQALRDAEAFLRASAESRGKADAG